MALFHSFLYSLIDLFLAVLGLCCFMGFSLVAGAPLVAVHGLLVAVASFFSEHGLQGTQASVVAAHGLRSCGSQALEHLVDLVDLVTPQRAVSSWICVF